MMVMKVTECVCAEMSCDQGTCFGSTAAESAKTASKDKETSSNTPTARTAKEVMRYDMSSVTVGRDDDDGVEPIRVVVSAPGVKTDDLNVSVLDGTLTIHGETKGAGGEVFGVDRKLFARQGVELEATTWTHADGIITLLIPRKARKSIPIQRVAAAPSTTCSTSIGTTMSLSSLAAEEKKSDSDANEWVEMPAE